MVRAGETKVSESCSRRLPTQISWPRAVAVFRKGRLRAAVSVSRTRASAILPSAIIVSDLFQTARRYLEPRCIRFVLMKEPIDLLLAVRFGSISMERSMGPRRCTR